eukprot:TRINITY_DN96245_c0_g1_i1.p1 TRINITY_DN96245_c0_g1~~TRINITY_DN96245_c0_g1_i1.p1  ORF type:complete len:203 (+),score=22.53 TRINITY_DN96245_c0_g1_i1:118-726(+)
MISIITGGRRYSFCVDGQMVLVENCSAEDGRHDYVTGAVVLGPNVFHNCSACRTHADIGPHHRWGVGQLYDCITSDGPANVWDRGALGSGHGWAGAQVVFWNMNVSTMLVEASPHSRNWAIGCRVSNPCGGRKSSMTIDATSTTVGTTAVKGTWDFPNQMVQPTSLYRAQLAESLRRSARSDEQKCDPKVEKELGARPSGES